MNRLHISFRVGEWHHSIFYGWALIKAQPNRRKTGLLVIGLGRGNGAEGTVWRVGGSRHLAGHPSTPPACPATLKMDDFVDIDKQLPWQHLITVHHMIIFDSADW